MSALGSGMDIVFILSHRYLQRMAARVLRDGPPICLTTPFVFGRVAANRINGQAFRGVVPTLDSIRLENRPDRAVDVVLRLRALTGEIDDGSGFRAVTPSDFMEWPLTVRARAGDTPALTFEMTLDVLTEGATTPLPLDILAALGRSVDPVPLPIDELERRRTVTIETDEGPVPESRVALGFNAREVRVKAADAGLCVGLGVGYFQDDFRGHEEDAGVHCRPPEPSTLDGEFFQSTFNVSSSDLPSPPLPTIRYDWFAVLGESVVDAIIRVESSISDPGEAKSGCPNKNELFVPCMHVAGLGDGVIQLVGEGRIFLCEEVNVWATFFAHADLTLRSGATRGSYEGQYAISDVLLLTPLWLVALAWWSGTDVMDRIPASKRTGTLPLNLPATFGTPGSPVGVLTVDGFSIRPDGLVFYGRGSVSEPPIPSLRSPSRLLFGRACDGTPPPVRRRLRLFGRETTQICPPSVTGPDADRFSLVDPPELTPGGADSGRTGLRLGTAPLELTVELAGEVDGQYDGVLIIPSEAGLLSVELAADLRSAAIALDPTSLEISGTATVTACGAVSLPRPSAAVAVRNTGEGNLHVCDVQFVANPLNSHGRPVFGIGGTEFALAAEEARSVTFRADLDLPDGGRVYRSRARFVTNAGDVMLPLSAQLIVRSDFDGEEGLVGGLNPTLVDLICLGVDWRLIRGRDGLLLSPAMAKRIGEELGGRLCCPPHLLPVCQCLDLLEIELRNVSFERGLTLRSQDDEMTGELSTSGPRGLFPFRPQAAWRLDVDTREGDDFPNAELRLRRWLLRQVTLYQHDGILHDMAPVGDRLFVATEGGIEILGWGPDATLELQNSTRKYEGVRRIQAFGERALLISLSDTHRLVRANSDGFGKELTELDGDHVGTDVALLRPGSYVPYAFGLSKGALRTLDLSDPRKPRVLATIEISTGGDLEAHLVNGRLILVGQAGLTAYDVDDPAHPVPLARLQSVCRHECVFAIGGRLFLKAAAELEMLGFRDETRRELVSLAHFQATSWLASFLPGRRGPVRSRSHWLVIGDDVSTIKRVELLDNGPRYMEPTTESETRRIASP